MLSAKWIAVLSGLILGSSWILGGCGNGNNLVPANTAGTATGGVVGQCAYGMAYMPGAYGGNYGYPYGNSYGNNYGGCMAGYVFNGSQCVCTTNYYNNGGYGGYGGGCPVGYMYVNGTCVVNSNYGNGGVACPVNQYYTPGYGCHY